jgi:ribosomal protein S12 methylthiotransferase accessory factor YcaO
MPVVRCTGAAETGVCTGAGVGEGAGVDAAGVPVWAKAVPAARTSAVTEGRTEVKRRAFEIIANFLSAKRVDQGG